MKTTPPSSKRKIDPYSKYHMTFKEFADRFNRGEIAGSFSYDVETDYLEWEGFVSRYNKYKSSLNTLL